MVIKQRNCVSLFIEVSCSGNIAGGSSLKPQFPIGLLHWSRQRLSPVFLGRVHSRGTAELEVFKGMSEPLPKLMLVLDVKSSSCCPGHSPSRCSVPRIGMELAVKPLAQLLGTFPPGARESHVSTSCRARGSLMI